jgi:hypothetical protein
MGTQSSQIAGLKIAATPPKADNSMDRINIIGSVGTPISTSTQEEWSF